MKQKLVTVPKKSILNAGKAPSGTGHWKADYNVAVWLSFKHFKNEAIHLYIDWKDDKGVNSILVDKTMISSGAILLSGIAHLKHQGSVEYMIVSVATKSRQFTIDELFVQPKVNSSSSQFA